MENRLLRLRALVQAMDRSIDDVRRRRLGIDRIPSPAPEVVKGKLKATRIDRPRDEDQARRTG